MLLTDRKLQAAKPGDKLSEKAPRGSGRLLVRVSASGTREFFYRSRAGGKDRLHKIGNHPELSLAEARRRVQGLAGSPVALEARGTLGDLLNAYVEHLKAAGKVSADDVERTLLRALPEKHAQRRRRASAITSQDVTNIIAVRVREGVTVEANRLRSHLSAAFSHGAHADNDPRRASADGIRFGLTTNPVTVVARLEEGNDENGEPQEVRVLTWKELGAYWRALEAEPQTIRATLRFILAIGGQHMQQVLRTEWVDIEKQNAEIKLGIIRMIDTKGRGKPRKHAVPILPFAQAQLDLLAGGERPFEVSHFNLADAIARASKAVVKALGCKPFDARALRRSVETRLGDLGVGRETRAHLLSHGRTGIQNRYDFAERLPEKLDALKLWTRDLEAFAAGKSAKVLPMRRKAS